MSAPTHRRKNQDRKTLKELAAISNAKEK